MSARLERCRACGLATPADSRVCVACGQPWRLAVWQRIAVEAAAASWAGWFVLLAVLLAGTGAA